MKFHEDATILSGETGTKLKCEILGGYYPTWWGITSGGPAKKFQNLTAIIELNASTGEDYIEETGETILGSSGHALQLKMENQDAQRLRVVLVEENPDCYGHLKNVIRKRWPKLDINEAEGPPEANETGVYLIQKPLKQGLETIVPVTTNRNSLFFFDPLLYSPLAEIRQVALSRIQWYYKTGTEFIVFLFTSDWFRGRKAFAPIPSSSNESRWTASEVESVRQMDALMGSSEWRNSLIKESPYEQKIESLIQLYKHRMHSWFRYVVPLPFEPKTDQLYHLFMCSNYEAGVKITRDFYTKYTGNSQYSPSNIDAYARFKKIHPNQLIGLKHNERPTSWKLLWLVIKEHPDYRLDSGSPDLVKNEADGLSRENAIKWLESAKYIRKVGSLTSVWKNTPQSYELDWNVVSANIGVFPAPDLQPMKSRPERVTKS